MEDLDEVSRSWQPWLAESCRVLGVDPSLVSVHEVHDLGRTVSRVLVRPMAPVAAFVWGLARAQHPDVDAGVLKAAILQTLPDEERP